MELISFILDVMLLVSSCSSQFVISVVYLIGQIGTETTINTGDLAGILMVAVQALKKRTAELKQKEAQIAVLASKLEEITTNLETVEPRLEGVTIPQKVPGESGSGDQINAHWPPLVPVLLYLRIKGT